MFENLKNQEAVVKKIYIAGFVLFAVSIVTTEALPIVAFIAILAALVAFIVGGLKQKKITAGINQYVIEKGYTDKPYKKIFVTRFANTPYKVLKSSKTTEAFDISIRDFYTK